MLLPFSLAYLSARSANWQVKWNRDFFGIVTAFGKVWLVSHGVPFGWYNYFQGLLRVYTAIAKFDKVIK